MKLTDNSIYLLQAYGDICITTYKQGYFYDLWCSSPKNLDDSGWSASESSEVTVLAELGSIPSTDYWLNLAQQTYPKYFI